MKNITAQQMIKELLDSGLSQKGIADQAGTSQANICRIADGQDPRYELGKAIEALYQSRINQAA